MPSTVLHTKSVNILDIEIIKVFLVPSLRPMSPLPPESHWRSCNSGLSKDPGCRSSMSRCLMLGSPPSPPEGQVLNDGKVFIHLCNYIEPWENLSFLQRESLNLHYHLNCGCQVRNECPFPGSFGGGEGSWALQLHPAYSPLFMHVFIHLLEICQGQARYEVGDGKARWPWALISNYLHFGWEGGHHIKQTEII